MPTFPTEESPTALATATQLATLLQRSFTAAEAAAADLVLDIASETIRTFCHQTLSLVEDDTLTVWADWRTELWLPERPVTELTSITVDGVLVDDSTYTWDQSGEVRFSPVWTSSGPTPWHRRQAVIVYSHGFDPMRADLRGMCLELAKAAVVTPDAGGGVTQEQIGNYSVTFDTKVAAILNDAQMRRLRPYRPVITGVPITV